MSKAKSRQNGKPNTGNQRTSPDKNSIPWAGTIAFLAPILVYLQTVGFGYTHFDDDGMLTNNTAFYSDLKNVFKAFITDQFINGKSLFYRPLGTVSYLIDYAISGPEATWMLHLTNVLLLGLCSYILYRLLQSFSLAGSTALLGTLLFVLNPLFVSTVAHLPNRAELLLLVFSLASFLHLRDFLANGNTKSMVLNWLFFTLALFSKETAAFLPFVFFVYYLVMVKEKKFEKSYGVSLVLYATSGAAWYWLRSKAIVGVPGEGDVFGMEALALNMRIIPEAFCKFLLPVDLSPIPAFSSVRLVIGLLITGSLLLLGFTKRIKPMNDLLFGAAWFIILILPSMLYKHPLIDYLDHRFMLPLAGIYIVLFASIPPDFMRRYGSRFSSVAVVLIFCFGILSFSKSKAYASPIRFYDTVVERNPTSSFGFNNRGYLRKMDNNLRGALEDFNRSIEIEPDFASTYCNRGVIRSMLNDKTGALTDIDKAIQLDSTFATAYNYRGVIHHYLGNYKQAVVDYGMAITCKPDFSEAYCNRGISHLALSSFPEAEADFNKTILYEPTNSLAYYSRGVMRLQQSRKAEAVADFDSAIVIKPDYTDAYVNKAIALGSSGNYAAALTSLNKALEYNPTLLTAYMNRAMVKFSMRDFKGAVEDCDVVLRMDPSSEKAKNYRGMALQSMAVAEKGQASAN